MGRPWPSASATSSSGQERHSWRSSWGTTGRRFSSTKHAAATTKRSAENNRIVAMFEGWKKIKESPRHKGEPREDFKGQARHQKKKRNTAAAAAAVLFYVPRWGT